MMMVLCRAFIVSGAALGLTGCGFVDKTVWPVLSGETGPASAPGVAKTPAPGASPPAAPARRMAAGDAIGPDRVGQLVPGRVGQLAKDLDNLTAALDLHDTQLAQMRKRRGGIVNDYDKSLTIVRTRLRIGATRRDPALTGRWNAANRHLARLDTGISGLNTLANEVTATAMLADFLLRTSRAAYALKPQSGSRQVDLVGLENRFTASHRRAARLLREVNRDIDGQITYLAREKGILRALALDVENGRARPKIVAGAGQGRELYRKPLVVIRFDRPKIAYEMALYKAMKAALERRPDARFDLVAVAPASRSTAAAAKASSISRRRATAVVRTLTDMGVPMKRLILSQTSSTAAKVTEVHLYVR